MYFLVPTEKGLLTTRAHGEELRDQLERDFNAQRPRNLEMSFGDVAALTISFADEFLGRFLTEIRATTQDPVLVLLTGLTDDTWQEVDVVLERRKIGAAFVKDGQLDFLGGDRYLKETFRQAAKADHTTPAELAARLGTTVQNVNNRLKKLVELGALERSRVNLVGGGREFSYQVPAVFRSSASA